MALQDPLPHFTEPGLHHTPSLGCQSEALAPSSRAPGHCREGRLALLSELAADPNTLQCLEEEEEEDAHVTKAMGTHGRNCRPMHLTWQLLTCCYLFLQGTQ